MGFNGESGVSGWHEFGAYEEIRDSRSIGPNERQQRRSEAKRLEKSLESKVADQAL